MAAGDLITITKNTMSAYDTGYSLAAALIANAATADTDGLKQPYRYLPTKADSKTLLIIQQVGAAAAGNSTLSVSAGVGGMAAVSALSATLVKNTTNAFMLDGRYKQEDGYFEFEITPNAGDKCLTDNALTVAVVEIV